MFALFSFQLNAQDEDKAKLSNSTSRLSSSELQKNSVKNDMKENARTVLNLEKVLASSLAHFPLVKSALQDKNRQEAILLQAEGAFDYKFKVKYDERYEGYYDAQRVKAEIEKPLRAFNSRLYAGFTRSEGEMPVYEQKMFTLSDGEYRIGLALSLLQNRSIDKNRLKLQISELKLKVAELDYLNELVEVRKEATKAYWKWVTKGLVVSAYEELLKFAVDRQDALEKRVKRGDVADIYLVENNQYILQRQTSLAEANQDFNISSFKLSMFFRDNEGRPLLAPKEFLPNLKNELMTLSDQTLESDVERAMELSPKLRSLQNKINQASLNQQFAENQLLPKLDINIESSKDFGDGSKTLKGTEHRAYVNFEIPLERRKAKGMLRAARFERNSLSLRQSLQAGMLEVKLKEFFTRVNTSYIKVQNFEQEILLAKRLVEAENIKFQKGASDFFLINIREQNFAKARIENIKAYYKYYDALAEYFAVNFGFLADRK